MSETQQGITIVLIVLAIACLSRAVKSGDRFASEMISGIEDC